MTDILKTLLYTVVLTAVLLSCQKELDWNTPSGTAVVPELKPRVGTVWTYRYILWHSYGGVASTGTFTHMVKSEDTLGGQKWLRVVDAAADTVVYWLQLKTDGLYHFANNTANMLCKNPATLYEQYNSFYKRTAGTFTVLGIKDTLPTDVGDIPANYYEYKQLNAVTEQIWYNDKYWIVRYQTFRKSILGTAWYRYGTFYLTSLVY